MLRSPLEEAERLSRAIAEARQAVRRCSVCNTLTEADPCEVCSDPERDASVLCVVEDPGNVVVIEKTREYRGPLPRPLGRALASERDRTR